MTMKNMAEDIRAKVNKIELDNDWFEVLELPKNTFAIIENGHFQEVCSFLVIGSDRALLFDTGMGISDISAVVKQLTDLDVIVVNSHTHFDHIGDDWRFPNIHVFADDYAVNVLSEGYSHWDVRFDSDPELFTKEYPAGFEPETYSIKPVDKKNIHIIHNDDIIDLGNRQLKVIHTPGHSQDSIMLHDEKNQILFTGDTYCEFIFAFFDNSLPKYGQSNLTDLRNSLQKILKLVPDLEFLYPSHGQHISDPMILIKAEDAIRQIIHGRIPDSQESIYGAQRKIFNFDDFEVWS